MALPNIVSNSEIFDAGGTPEINLGAPYGMVWIGGDAGATGSVTVDVAGPLATNSSAGTPNYRTAATVDLSGVPQRVSPDFPVQHIRLTGTGSVHVMFFQRIIKGAAT